jgi:hypothetical protein
MREGDGTKKEGAAADSKYQPASHCDGGSLTAAPGKKLQGASELATGQPRKPKAAHLVDWFYVTSSFN